MRSDPDLPVELSEALWRDPAAVVGGGELLRANGARRTALVARAGRRWVVKHYVEPTRRHAAKQLVRALARRNDTADCRAPDRDGHRDSAAGGLRRKPLGTAPPRLLPGVCLRRGRHAPAVLERSIERRGTIRRTTLPAVRRAVEPPGPLGREPCRPEHGQFHRRVGRNALGHRHRQIAAPHPCRRRPEGLAAELESLRRQCPHHRASTPCGSSTPFGRGWRSARDRKNRSVSDSVSNPFLRKPVSELGVFLPAHGR